ncbi:5-methylcytosine g t mismatch-specific dna [Colletotrichum truncatum]|uniref:5-methylcytosine g t mismatch-specific dna n=1 Tax=Colletotrichum truncatum TaxID=5467 RepID=A0ACC3Z1G9_COLTU|nr:5-methylcytosine g t mismatch-specific dna [Colletotrichum truncatum]KAF6788912.1 5-methylcytosine g t mismatch-specific dna [Colletotrichum truncatum]
MSSKDRDVDVVDDVDRPPREKKTSRSKSERSLRSEKDKGDREHRSHRVSSRSSKSRMVDGSGLSSDTHSSHRRHRTREERDRDREHRDKERGHDRSSSMNDLVPEFAKTSLTGPASTDRISIPYPTFSKAHSKEAVCSREDVSGSAAADKRGDPFTPEATDLGQSDIQRSKSVGHSEKRKVSSKKDSRPPSPPETDLSGKRRSGTPESSKKDREERSSSRLSGEKRDRDSRPSSRVSGLSRSASRADERSRVSFKSKTSSQATYVKSPAFPPGVQESLNIKPSSSRSSSKRSSSSKKSRRSDNQDGDSSPESAQDSSPRTPTQPPNYPPPLPPTDKLPAFAQVYADDITPSGTPATDFGGPPPPPPPPPLDVQEAPRVDYLLQNGGLFQPIPKTFLSVLPRQNGARPSNPPLVGPQTLFAPFFNLLDQYNQVLNKNGSVAVATGHRSVARRLLDRLENVFSRELPEYGCTCVVCESGPEIQHRGLGWGEVLEWVSGRIELPQWPPFDLASLGSNAADSAADLPPRPDSPIKIDPDIAEEFREHYLRQSKKVRGAVDKWLNNCGDSTAPSPQDVDDETLTFAMLTNLDPEDQPYFNAILSGSNQIKPMPRAPTPSHRPRPDFIVKAGLSLQRIYRLQQAPRDAEVAMYLIKNPHTHDLIVTMSDINTQEWEILTSGRFDGFLWSGADGDDLATPTAESRGATPASNYFPSRPSTMSPGFRGPASRNATPYSRGATPASFVSGVSSAANRQAVSRDEEMEMAILAEVEREIYQGMEALEDAFEALHLRAEVVRTALRNRGAGLARSLQNRRRIDVLPNPGSGNSQSSGYERPSWAQSDYDANSDDDWGGDDFELAPDDSASNISSSRHRRPKRRTERRTPAPIEEDDEEN